MDAPSPIRTVRHEVARFSIDVGEGYEPFRQRFEQQVPPWPQEQVVALARRAAPWQDVVAQAAAVSPSGLFTYWRSEQAQLMRLAGERWECTSYLVGNTIVAQRMFHRDPAVMSAVPFHVAVTVGADGATRLTLDQPSTHLTSFDGPVFAATAPNVDERFGETLRALGVPVPPELLPSS